jgi:hypothetical protein
MRTLALIAMPSFGTSAVVRGNLGAKPLGTGMEAWFDDIVFSF